MYYYLYSAPIFTSMKPITTLYTTWIEINQSNLEHNIEQYKNFLGTKTGIAAVIKANAYGHGLYEIASVCDNNNLVQRLCVVNTEEALLLRKRGIKKPILVMGYINSDVQTIMQHNIDLTVYDAITLHELQKVAATLDRIATIQLKVDTGLSRLGVLPNEVKSYIQLIHTLPNLRLQGIWSHIANDSDLQSIHNQEDIFATINDPSLESHIAKSQASLQTKYKYTIARIGIGLYGYLPSPHPLRDKLKPVLSLKSRIIHIKKIPAGQTIGYTKIKTTTPTTIAIVAIGYYDGINSQLIHGGNVIIHGHYAPIVSINMNMTTVDISHIPQCKIHDTVILLGKERDKEISAYDWQKTLKLNLRESLVNLESSIPRIITNNTKT